MRHSAGSLPVPGDVVINKSPSDLCVSKNWRALQFPSGDAPPAFACFRPAVKPPQALPAALISPIFAAFLRDAAVSDLGPCSAESEAVAALVTNMPYAFSREADRVMVFNGIMNKYLGVAMASLQPDASSSSACMDSGVLSSDRAHLLLLQEAKNEMGSADPWFQGQRYYQVFWDAPQRRNTPLFTHDARPALFLELVGPNLRVSAVASLAANRVVCEPLTPFLPLFALTGQAAYLLRLAATLRAMRQAVAALADHYKAAALRLRDAPPPAASTPRSLPYPLRDRARFVDVAALLPHGGKLLYKATELLPSGQQRAVCVKFTPRAYPAYVHEAWAGAQLAPQLFACETLPDGATRMVLMELLAPPEWVCFAEMDLAQRSAIRPFALLALQVSVGPA